MIKNIIILIFIILTVNSKCFSQSVEWSQIKLFETPKIINNSTYSEIFGLTRSLGYSFSFFAECLTCQGTLKLEASNDKIIYELIEHEKIPYQIISNQNIFINVHHARYKYIKISIEETNGGNLILSNGIFGAKTQI